MIMRMRISAWNLATCVALSIATSIDALAVGITFAFLQVNILPAVSFIGLITFILSMVGVKIGNVFGTKYKSKGRIGRWPYIDSHRG